MRDDDRICSGSGGMNPVDIAFRSLIPVPITHSESRARWVSSSDRPGASRGTPSILPTEGRRRSPSSNNVFSPRPNATARLSAKMDLPSLPIEEVTRMILCGLSRLSSEMAVRIVRMTSAKRGSVSLVSSLLSLVSLLPSMLAARRASFPSGGSMPSRGRLRKEALRAASMLGKSDTSDKSEETREPDPQGLVSEQRLYAEQGTLEFFLDI